MCGQIKKSKSPEEAVNFAIAYGKRYSEVLDPVTGTYQPGDVEVLRQEAAYFIKSYTPVRHRAEALESLDKRTDAGLTTELTYYDIVY